MFSFSFLKSGQLGKTTQPLSPQTGPSKLSPTGKANACVWVWVCVHSSVSVYRCGGEEGPAQTKDRGQRRVERLSETEKAE